MRLMGTARSEVGMVAHRPTSPQSQASRQSTMKPVDKNNGEKDKEAEYTRGLTNEQNHLFKRILEIEIEM